tara:strand:- start:1087 stop:1572 length:486 start_codon:yes stop_codon:yes gene_type:complete
MFLWNKVFCFSVLITFICGCQTANKVSKVEEISLYLVELGDREFKQDNYISAYQNYQKALRKNNSLKDDINFLARLMKVSLKMKNAKSVNEYYKFLNDNKSRLIHNNFSKEIYHYLLGKFYIFKKEPARSKSNFEIAKKLGEGKRDTFYDCLIQGEVECKK